MRTGRIILRLAGIVPPGLALKRTGAAILMAGRVMSVVGDFGPLAVPVMGPGGCRFADCHKIGVPLSLVVFIMVLLPLPWLWPLRDRAIENSPAA